MPLETILSMAARRRRADYGFKPRGNVVYPARFVARANESVAAAAAGDVINSS